MADVETRASDEAIEAPAAPPITTVIQITAFDPEARVDPYPRLRALQETAPVFQDEFAKTTVLTRYADVKAVVNDRTLWRSPLHAEEGSLMRRNIEEGVARARAEGRQAVGSILMMDDPDHQRIRQPLTQAFYARVAALKPEIEAIVGQVIGGLQGRERFDLIGEVAIPVPIFVIAKVLGVDPDRLDDFRAWSEACILSLNPMMDEAQRAHMTWGAEAVSAHFQELMESRRREPRADLISDLVRLQAEGAPLSDAEVRANLAALLIGGNLTTTDLIGNGVRLLMTHPEQLAAFRADPSLAANLVEEVLRYDPPVDGTGRVASRDMEIGGCPIANHRGFTASLRAANRDPSVFPDPDRFDVTRRNGPHVAFGGGSHICIGAPLARIEAKAAFTELFARFPNLRMPEQDLTWRALPFFRGVERLELETGAPA